MAQKGLKTGQNGQSGQYDPKYPFSPISAIFTHFSHFDHFWWHLGEKGEKGVFVVKYPEIGFSGYMAQNGLFWPILRVYGSEWAKMGLFWLIWPM